MPALRNIPDQWRVTAAGLFCAALVAAVGVSRLDRPPEGGTPVKYGVFTDTRSPYVRKASPLDGMTFPHGLLAGRLEIFIGDSGFPELPLRVTSTSRCALGDLDVIGRDVARRPGASESLLFSLEPLLDVPDAERHVAPTSIAEIAFGTRASLPLKLRASFSVVGVFVCTDVTGTGECASKQAADPDELIRELRRPAPSGGAGDLGAGSAGGPAGAGKPADAGGPAGAGGQDVVYYFAPFLVDHQEARPLRMTPDVGRTEELAGILSRVRGAASHVEALVKRASVLAATLRSVPPRESGGGFVVDLPRFDKAACGR